MIKTFAELKRILQPGVSLTLVKSTGIANHKYLNIPRKIDRVQTNAIRFDGGSWLYWGKAGSVRFTDNGFQIDNGFIQDRPAFEFYLEYIFGEVKT